MNDKKMNVMKPTIPVKWYDLKLLQECVVIFNEINDWSQDEEFVLTQALVAYKTQLQKEQNKRGKR